MNAISSIDWRDQLAQLDPYLKSRGGYIKVRYSRSCCAPLSFVKTIFSRFEQEQSVQSACTVRLDAEDFQTRYLDGILNALAKAIKCPTESFSDKFKKIPNLNIGSNNKSSGNQTINISIDGIGIDADSLFERKLSNLFKHIDEFLQNSRMLIIITSIEPASQKVFWSQVWADCLSPLTAKGLLLIKMEDCSAGEPRLHIDEDTPLLEIELPTSLTPPMQNDAISDLADILVSATGNTLEKGDAINRVSGVVYAHWDAIDRLHNCWGAVLIKLVDDVKN